MKELVIICITITIIYLVYAFRYDLRYFFSLANISFKNKKGVKDLQKKDMNKRRVSNENIKTLVSYAKNSLNERRISRKGEFIVEKELERHLKYSRFSEKYLDELLKSILRHMNLNREDIDFKVEYMSSRNGSRIAGLYFEKKGENKPRINLYIKNDMTYETIIATLAHECSHHLLLSNGIQLKDRVQNECLTDVVTILMGFGKYMIKGYEISNRVIYEEEFLRLVDKDRVGYLSTSDIKYVLRKYYK